MIVPFKIFVAMLVKLHIAKYSANQLLEIYDSAFVDGG